MEFQRWRRWCFSYFIAVYHSSFPLLFQRRIYREKAFLITSTAFSFNDGVVKYTLNVSGDRLQPNNFALRGIPTGEQGPLCIYNTTELSANNASEID